MTRILKLIYLRFAIFSVLVGQSILRQVKMKDPKEIISNARKAFNSGKTKTYEFRYKTLQGLQRFVEENEKQIIEILKKENGKPHFEAMTCEINPVKNDIKNALYKLKDWMKPVKVEKSIAFIMDQPMIQYDPFGVVLVMGAWNYPLMLTLSPVIGAIAAGNCVVIKPSDVTPLCGQFLEENLPKYLDNECFPVFNGGIPETTSLLEQKFDYIFYTGGTPVGKIIYQAAAKYLTPVTLELGGKSPVYLDDSADIGVAANRIMWGKCLNAGQSCIGPDYLLCSEYAKDKFIRAAKKSVKKWYGENIRDNLDFVRIINERQFNRIKKLLEGSKIVMGGETDQAKLYIEPTIVTGVKKDDPIMSEEIFGPVLPIYTVETPEEAIEFINSGEKPLAIYVFGNSKTLQEKFLLQTSSGGICFNDTLMQFTCDSLPFGGVGSSGMGMYHGKFSFDTFSHKKGTLVKKLDKVGELVTGIRYPPYTDKNLKLLTLVTKKIPPIPGSKYFCQLVFFVILGLILYLFRIYNL